MNCLFVDNLTVIDFAYLHPDRGLVGESWIVDVELLGDLDEQGMVFDFSAVKRIIKRVIDECVDHKLAVPILASNLVLQQQHGRAALTWQLQDGTAIRQQSPLEALALVNDTHITPDSISLLIRQALRRTLPGNVSRVNLTLREEVIGAPYYHYVHGLKKHGGNCQRIAHGHRSRIEIWRDGQRASDLELAWAARWKDIYVGTEEDIVNRFSENEVSYLHFAYQANQGEFELEIPEARVYLMDTDTTVELIAAHFADVCKQSYPDQAIQVKAYEGVGKGAIARR